eukprot:Awhi_evm2s13220
MKFYLALSAALLGSVNSQAVTCDAGEYFVTGACEPCPINNYCAGGVEALATAVPCASGTTQVADGAEVCSPCGPGNFIQINQRASNTCESCSVANTLNNALNDYGPITAGNSEYYFYDPSLTGATADKTNNVVYTCPGLADMPFICPRGEIPNGARSACVTCSQDMLCRLGQEFTIGAGMKQVPLKIMNTNPVYPDEYMLAQPSEITMSSCQYESGYPELPLKNTEDTGIACQNGIEYPCYPGFEAASNNWRTCRPCPTGEICLNGKASSETCIDGQKPNANRTACVSCGEFQACEDGVETTCMEGKHIHAGVCHDCPDNDMNYCNGTHAMPCPEGHICKLGKDNGQCADGTYAQTIQIGENTNGNINTLPVQNVLLPTDFKFKRVCTPCTETQNCTLGLLNSDNGAENFAAGFTVTMMGLMASYYL